MPSPNASSPPLSHLGTAVYLLPRLLLPLALLLPYLPAELERALPPPAPGISLDAVLLLLACLPLLVTLGAGAAALLRTPAVGGPDDEHYLASVKARKEEGGDEEGREVPRFLDVPWEEVAARRVRLWREERAEGECGTETR
ncbi:hypothetical protein TeGR_g10744 [Tetraparma gracilis]|uniref:Uncharacterized protein n=1 Tax=Tetraparma gracilis TaxID=2962635 RepID=A0ABQ6M566_9STRA|nr:hypothetical protein TeGR_g10744 [Tetraparma gracilis]